MTDKSKSTSQFDLRYLFYVTTLFAMAAWMLTQRDGNRALSALGLGIIEYWCAKGLFALSVRLPKVAREVVFLIGLPFYCGAIVLVVSSIAMLCSGIVSR